MEDHRWIWHFTFSTHRRRPVFDDHQLVRVCAAAFQEVCERHAYRALALAILPDHVHFILSPGTSGHRPAKIMNNIKGVASRRLSLFAPALKSDLRSDHLWTESYHSAVLLDAGAVQAE